MKEKLQEVFRTVFSDQELMITESTTADDIPMWDSLTHLELIATIEEAFLIRFSFDEVMKFQTVGDMLRSLELKSGAGN
ncbi:MAG: acyl carrier protein [Bacteroidota bacterium]|nr:acyl carrier protein [Bacteroidota bacterium]